MNRHRFTWSVVLVSFAALLGLSTLYAEGTQEGTPTGKPVEIRFRYYAWPNHAKIAKRMEESFNAKNPGVKLIWDGFAGTSDDERAKYLTMLMAGAGDIDIMLLDSPWLTEFASKGWLVPLNQLTPDVKAVQDEFFPFANSIASYNGTQYGLGLSTDVSFLYYRKDLLSQQGLQPPATLDELAAAAQKVSSPPNHYGLLFQGAQYEGLVCTWIEILHNLGGTIFGESRENPAGGVVGQRKSQLYSPASVRATQMVHDLIFNLKVSPPGTVGYTEGEVRKLYEAGGSAMAREWMDMVLEFNDPAISRVAGQVGVAPLPAGPAGSHSCIGGWVYGVNKFTPNQKQAWSALQHLTSVESQTDAMVTAGMVASRPATLMHADIRNHPLWGPALPTVLQAVQTGIPRPLSAIWPQQSDKIQQAIHKVFVGEMTADAAMRWADGQIQAIENSY